MTVPFKIALAAALVAGIVTPAPAHAWFVPGCSNLPEYERALGALQGMTSACDMSLDEAKRIVAAHGNVPGGLFGMLLSNPPPPVIEAVPTPRQPHRGTRRPAR